ncbi:hypothetical protein COAQ111491_17920 [Comamonas aquatilis]|uniref:hypothetical protein n=1 Tax=Comamonas aquatilis TaxID=1778406 RepID=UPI0039F0DC99
MIKAQDGPWKYLILWLRYYYAIHFLKSGINFAVFGVVPDFSKAGAVGPYMHEMNVVGFYPLVKYMEIVLGSMLLLNVLVPVALAFMAGIAFQIIYLNLFVSPHPRQLFTGTQELLLCGLLILAYGKSFVGLFQLRAKPGFLWQPQPSDGRALLAADSTPPYTVRSKDMFLIIAVAVVWTVVVIGFSTSMGSRPLRIYDWGPPVGALLLTLIAMLIDRTGSASQRMNREVTPA